MGLEGDDVVVRIDDHDFLLPMKQIDKARVQPRLDSKGGKQGQSSQEGRTGSES